MVFIGLLSDLTGHFRAFYLAFFCLPIVNGVFCLFVCSGFHQAPLILNASYGCFFFIHFLVPSSSCGFVLVSIS